MELDEPVYGNTVDHLIEFADQFDDVFLENLDWADVFEKYDSKGTVFYRDPPYVGYEDYSLVNTIDHAALVDGLAGLEGDWICSYEDARGVRRGVRARSRREAVR